MLRATHDGASNQGIQGHIQLAVLLVAGVLGQQAEALPLPAVLRDDGHLPGVVSENGIYGHSRFCNTDFDDKLACLNLSGV